jgi:hypothetical protein
MVPRIEFSRTLAMAPPSPLAVGDQNATIVIVIKCGPSDHRSTTQIRRYRFRGYFPKELLGLN